MAALDIGSNTIRLLVVQPGAGSLVPIFEDSRFVSLGSGVEERGNLDPERKQTAIRVIAEFVAIGKQLRVNCFRAFATSAVRDAVDGEAFAEDVSAQTGIHVDILSGEEEARLTFLGTTLGIDVRKGALVTDVGGGSSEIVASGREGIEWAQSLRIGSGRLTERFVHHDPPLSGERRCVEDFVRKQLRLLPRPFAPVTIVTGGTATNLAHVAGKSDRSPSGKHPNEPADDAGRWISVRVTAGDIDRAEATCYDLAASELSRMYGIRIERSRVLPAGITIIRTISSWAQSSEILITRHGIREGAIVEELHKMGLWKTEVG